MSDKRFCEFCGSDISPQARFCGYCGKSMVSPTPTTSQVETISTEKDVLFAPTQESAQGQYDQSKQAVKSKDLLNLARKIIITSAGVGLNAAGLTLCGPAWPFFRAVLTPVILELQQKYPTLSLQDKAISKQDAEQGANTLERDEHLIHMLESAFEREFKTLKHGQEEIIARLVRQDETLEHISEVVERAQRTSNEEFRLMNIKLDKIAEQGQRAPSQPTLTLNQIDVEANALQSDAVQWTSAGQPSTARRRLTEARGLIADGLQQNQLNTNLLTLLGYVEKTESQICQFEGDALGASTAIDKAGDFFGAALKLDPEDIGAKNGLADVYILTENYDAAIAFGRILARDVPTYTAAAWDFAIALEGKIKLTAPDSDLLQELISTYTRLVPLLKETRTGFAASDLAYVEERLDEVKKELDQIHAKSG